MGHGAFQKWSVVIASAATISSEIDLGRAFKRVYIDPTNAASEVRFQAAAGAGGTYRQVYLPQNTGNTATVQSNIWKIGSAASGGLQEAPPGLRFMKVETTASVTNGVTLTLLVSDS